ncbi:MAG: type I-U CRISPR-associated protein Cas7 [Hyphomicrobiales bacterium]|nr:type I-U CRISPR-associated protein Cas7 [Hyphomicrobiales bacterium]
MTLTLERLREAVTKDAAIRRVQKLQPVGGPGDKIFPPTYPGEGRNAPARHVFEYRRINGRNVLCVLIDSVQSQANRLEEALKAARDLDLAFPVISVDFADTDVSDIGQITTLDAPHRVFDAIIRDSELNGTRFKETDAGKRLVAAKSQNARAVYELSPTTLIFGAWNSTGEGGGLGAKFPRAVVSEIIGIEVATEREVDSRTGEVLRDDAPSGHRTGSRIDPLGIRSGVAVYKMPNGDWSLDPPADKKAKTAPKEVRPSEINHSNIAPSVTPLGVTVDYAQHVFVLSFSALRRLRFVGNSGSPSAADVLARTALATLALASVAAQDQSGYFLRSRCDLVPGSSDTGAFEIVRADGQAEPTSIDFDAACRLVKEATAAAKAAGIPWNAEDLVLKPQSKLVQLVSESRKRALQGEAEAKETEG